MDFNYLFNKIVYTDGWMTLDLKTEISSYFRDQDIPMNFVDNLFWMVKEGYSRRHIKEMIHQVTGKTTDDLDQIQTESLMFPMILL
jgi:hypothetical protein